MPARVWIRLVQQNASLVWAGIVIRAASWILGFLANRAWMPLIGPTFRVVEWLLLAFGQDVVSQPASLLLGTPQFAIEIYPACAGYEGIGLISVFVGSYLWLFRRSLRFPQAFILGSVITVPIAAEVAFRGYKSLSMRLSETPVSRAIRSVRSRPITACRGCYIQRE